MKVFSCLLWGFTSVALVGFSQGQEESIVSLDSSKASETAANTYTLSQSQALRGAAGAAGSSSSCNSNSSSDSNSISDSNSSTNSSSNSNSNSSSGSSSSLGDLVFVTMKTLQRAAPDFFDKLLLLVGDETSWGLESAAVDVHYFPIVDSSSSSNKWRGGPIAAAAAAPALLQGP